MLNLPSFLDIRLLNGTLRKKPTISWLLEVWLLWNFSLICDSLIIVLIIGLWCVCEGVWPDLLLCMLTLGDRVSLLSFLLSLFWAPTLHCAGTGRRENKDKSPLLNSLVVFSLVSYWCFSGHTDRLATDSVALQVYKCCKRPQGGNLPVLVLCLWFTFFPSLCSQPLLSAVPCPSYPTATVISFCSGDFQVAPGKVIQA